MPRTALLLVLFAGCFLFAQKGYTQGGNAPQVTFAASSLSQLSGDASHIYAYAKITDTTKADSNFKNTCKDGTSQYYYFRLANTTANRALISLVMAAYLNKKPFSMRITITGSCDLRTFYTH